MWEEEILASSSIQSFSFLLLDILFVSIFSAYYIKAGSKSIFYILLFQYSRRLLGYLDKSETTSQTSSELQTQLERTTTLHMIELHKFLDKYPISKLNSLWLKNLFLVALKQLEDPLEKIRSSVFGGNILLSCDYPNQLNTSIKYVHSINLMSNPKSSRDGTRVDPRVSRITANCRYERGRSWLTIYRCYWSLDLMEASPSWSEYFHEVSYFSFLSCLFF